MDLQRIRNIGISAHIDSGKTTLSERILFYTGRIHKIEEVRGDGAGATMDHMDLERERGITITSAATCVDWQDHQINLIDTPGHIDFTVEVERSLRVLDGAVLVLCAVGGVQSQSITVDRQMKRYHVPRVGFINKMDRIGANPLAVVEQMREHLATDAILMQLPIGAGETFEAVIDLVTMKALYFDGSHGESVRSDEIPATHLSAAQTARQQMLEALAMYSDELMEKLLSEEEVDEELIQRVLTEAVQQQGATPVFLGSAFKNKGVQPLLDAVTRYLPSPLDREIVAFGHEEEEKVQLSADVDKPLVAMAFKLVDESFGQLTYMRVYQGTMEKGQTIFNQRTGRKDRVSRILRMHADKREEVDQASAGDIVAAMGIDSASGDTYCAERKMCTLESIFVPEPVITVAIQPQRRQDADKLGKALTRFSKEDPTFHASTDEETGDLLIAGMGELHLDIYTQRISREYGVAIDVGQPKVSYRESPTVVAEFDYRFKKQTGGSGQFAHIVGRIEPLDNTAEEPFVFEENVVGGRIPKQYIPSVEKGFVESLLKGPIAEFPVVGVKVELDDGSYHEVDSSDKAFQTCARSCFRETFPRTKPVLLEPIMKVEVTVADQHQGAVVGDLNSRRGIITSTTMNDGETTIVSAVPLAEMFGYDTHLKNMTHGQGSFSMEMDRFRRVPRVIQDEIVADRRQALLVGS